MKNIILNKYGFTLVEFFVAVGISAVVVIPMTMFLSEKAQMSKTQVEKTSIGITDIIQAQNLIVQDLSEAEPSFNFLNVEGEAGDKSDVPLDCQNYSRKNFWEKTTKNSCIPLSLTLEEEGDEFIILKKVTSPSRMTMHFTPDSYFDLTPANAPGGNLTFVASRFVDKLMKPNSQNKSACLGKDYLKVSSLGDFSVPDGGSFRAAQYALVMPCAQSVAELQPLTSPLIFSFYKENCSDKNLYVGAKRLESFFRCMPVAGRLANTVAEPVEFIRYRVAKSSANPNIKKIRLMREKGSLAEGSSKFIPHSSLNLIEDFESVKFYRNFTAQSLIKFKISKSKNP